MSDRSNHAAVYVGTTLSANSDGTVNIVDYSVYGISNNSDGLTQARMTKGKYIRYEAQNGDFNAGDVWFIPSDASIEFVTNGIATNKRQPVTGYAAIPAGTTIEYLGKLGDKARVQVLSYVGTGTYGKDNPNTLNLSFTPRFLLVMDGDRMSNRGSYAKFALFVYGVANGITVGPSSANYEIPLYATWNKNSVSWYNTDSDYGSVAQMNRSGTKYRYVAIG